MYNRQSGWMALALAEKRWLWDVSEVVRSPSFYVLCRALISLSRSITKLLIVSY
jgi:hypothetical protein